MRKDLRLEQRTIVPLPNNLPYIFAVVIMMGLAVLGSVLAIILRPEYDNTGIIAAIFGFLTPTTLSLLAFMKSQETHLSVNSRLDQFMDNARIAAFSQGLAKGQNEDKK